MYFEIIGEISDVEIVAVGRAIQALSRLRKLYGPGRWRKLKGTALIRLPDGTGARPNCIGMRRTPLAREK